MSPVKKHRIVPGKAIALTRSAPDLSPWLTVWQASSPVETAAARSYLEEHGIVTRAPSSSRTDLGVTWVDHHGVLVRSGDVERARALLQQRPDLFPPRSSYAESARSPSKTWAAISSAGLAAQLGCVVLAVCIAVGCLLIVGFLVLAAFS